jgi:hypothetical protein
MLVYIPTSSLYVHAIDIDRFVYLPSINNLSSRRPAAAMHELPEGLNNSLRSFRGSIYGNSLRSKTRELEDDLEKGSDVYEKKSEDDDDDQVERPLRAVVLVRLLRDNPCRD